jgi:hypothetical protein
MAHFGRTMRLEEPSLKPIDRHFPDSPLRHLRLEATGGALVFQITSDLMHRTIHVVRTLRDAAGQENAMASGFDTLEKALQWIDADPARFDHPRLMLELKEVIRGLFEHFASAV